MSGLAEKFSVTLQNQTLTFILAGGVGSRLFPLTAKRSKPSVPFGGKYRIVDFTLTNCLHSGLRRILVLTQYKSHSLNKHLRDGWSVYNPELGEYITAVPAQMNQGNHWYQGTADAILQNLNLLERSDALLLRQRGFFTATGQDLGVEDIQEAFSKALDVLGAPQQPSQPRGISEIDFGTYLAYCKLSIPRFLKCGSVVCVCCFF